MDGMDGSTVALLEGRLVGKQCVVLLGGREVDGMDGNTLGALVVGRAELDRDTVAAGKWMDGNTVAALVVGRVGTR